MAPALVAPAKGMPGYGLAIGAFQCQTYCNYHYEKLNILSLTKMGPQSILCTQYSLRSSSEDSSCRKIVSLGV